MKKIKLQKVHLGGAKPLSRSELKDVYGGNTFTSAEPGRWCCCNDSGCSTAVYGDSNDLTCVDRGTSLQKC